jgi:hypothetical protein
VPYDVVSLLVAAVAGALLVAAAILRAGAARIGVVLLAAFLIRMDAGSLY